MVMAFISLVALLFIEQLLPLNQQRWVRAPLYRVADFVELHTNAGERWHAVAAWMVVVVGAVAIVTGVHMGLRTFSPLLGGVWTLIVLYLTLGFREVGHNFYEIQTALRMDDLARAVRCLGQWRADLASGATADEVDGMARIAAKEALLLAHRRVFGVLACFLLLPGLTGPVLYRLAEMMADAWGRKAMPGQIFYSEFSRRAFAMIDALPARMTAAAFAVVGDFENAMYCWRTQAATRSDPVYGAGAGIILAAGAGALGLRLDAQADEQDDGRETAVPGRLGVGLGIDADSLRRVTGLLWRVLLLWLLLLLLYGLAV